MTLQNALREYTNARKAVAAYERENLAIFQNHYHLRMQLEEAHDALVEETRLAKRGIVGRYFEVIFRPRAKRWYDPVVARKLVPESLQCPTLFVETVDRAVFDGLVKRGDIHPEIAAECECIEPMTPQVIIQPRVKVDVDYEATEAEAV